MVYSRGNGTISIFHDSQGVLQVCVTNDRNVGSLGVFYGDSPFDFVLPPTLCQLFIMFFTTRLLYFLLKPLRIPKFTCNIMVSFNKLNLFSFDTIVLSNTNI